MIVDKATEMALKAIVRGLVHAAPDMAIPDAITNSLFRMEDDLRNSHMPAEAHGVGTIAQFAMNERNARISS
jgi:hypothetical protein